MTSARPTAASAAAIAIEKMATDLRAQLIPSRLQRRIVGIDVMADSQRGLGISTTPFAEDAASFIPASNALYKAVIEPAGSVIGEKRILIVADGALNYVPFEALVKSADKGDYSSLPYLIKSNEVIYSPSASVVGAIRQQDNSRAGRAMLILADPVFNSNDARVCFFLVRLPVADRFQDSHFNAAVLRASVVRLVIRDRILFSESDNRDAEQRYVLADQIPFDSFGSPLAQSDVVLFVTGVVGISLYLDHVSEPLVAHIARNPV